MLVDCPTEMDAKEGKFSLSASSWLTKYFLLPRNPSKGYSLYVLDDCEGRGGRGNFPSFFPSLSSTLNTQPRKQLLLKESVTFRLRERGGNGNRGKQPLVLLTSPLLPEEEGPHMHVCVLFCSSLRPMVLSSFKTLAFCVSSLPLAQADRTMGTPTSSVFLCLKPPLNPNQTKEDALVSKQQEGVE